jgi:hypothetical protein
VTRKVQCQGAIHLRYKRHPATSKLIVVRADDLTTANAYTMQSLRRTAVTAARTGRTTLPRQQRRFAHDEHAHGHGHEPVNEPIGVRFAPRTPTVAVARIRTAR